VCPCALSIAERGNRFADFLVQGRDTRKRCGAMAGLRSKRAIGRSHEVANATVAERRSLFAKLGSDPQYSVNIR
jgi:hypothetical protein